MRTYRISAVVEVWIDNWEVEAEDVADAAQQARDAGTSMIEPRTATHADVRVYGVEDVSDDYSETS